MIDLNTLEQEAQQLFAVQLNQHQLEQFQIYATELKEWNIKINLTAIRDDEGIRIKHFLDSISCVPTLREIKIPERLIDVGTGAGFPGLVLKIIFPEMDLTLVESVGKKANFCKLIGEKLELKNVEVLNLRAEEVGQQAAHREKYDYAIARAVANLPILCEYLLPLVKVGGYMLAQKGQTGPTEVKTAEKAIKLLSGRFHQITPINLPTLTDERYLISIKKVASTPAIYPRLAGVAAKKPL